MSGTKWDLFTGVLSNLYQAPIGYCFDILCGDEPIVDDENSPEFNAERRSRIFVSHLISNSYQVKTKNVLVTMGGDFNYQDAQYYFKNLDKLIR